MAAESNVRPSAVAPKSLTEKKIAGLSDIAENAAGEDMHSKTKDRIGVLNNRGFIAISIIVPAAKLGTLDELLQPVLCSFGEVNLPSIDQNRPPA
jgi:hypothetical protein